MTTRLGIVAEAAMEQLVDTLAARFPQLPDAEIRATARAQVDDLRMAGWRITAPVTKASARPTARAEGQT